jgi:Ca-activated chloride channel family protein
MRRFRLGRGFERSGARGYAIAGAAVLVAIGGIVLLRAPGHAEQRQPDRGTLVPDGFEPVSASNTRFSGPSMTGHAALSQGAVLASGTRTVLSEIVVSASNDAAERAERAPVALAVVLDTSGSMTGEKIEQAKSAVRELVRRMHDRDQIAFVTYNHVAQVMQTLAPVGSARSSMEAQLAYVIASGGTQIPDALALGASQLTNAPSGYVRRVVLISDGLDGSGRPIEMVSQDIRERARAGATVSALGIGIDYDERFLTSVADAGHGNYEFLRTGTELASFLHRELEEASQTVIDEVVAALELPSGWRVTRTFGADSTTAGGETEVAIGSLFRGDSRSVVIELAVDAGAPGELGEIGLEVRYRTVADGSRHTVEGGELALESVPSVVMADASRDMEVHARTTAVLLEEQQAAAVDAWRAGDVARAQTITQQNIGILNDLSAAAPTSAPQLLEQAGAYERDNRNFGSVRAESEEGRAYGLESNVARRARVVR